MRRFLALLAISTVLIGGFLVMKDPGHVPLFDSNLARLAESELEGFCSGLVYWDSEGAGSESLAKDCRATYTDMSAVYDLTTVQWAFCVGVVAAGFNGDPTTDCLQFLQQERYWPTYDGALTNAWAKGYRYPGDVFVAVGNGSRTGDREEAPREEIVRP